MNRQIILFGAGRDGREALEFFGNEAVFCFVDNDKEKVGSKIDGKKIISFDDLKNLFGEFSIFSDIQFELVITIGLSKWAVLTVALQLIKNGIEQFSVYSDVKKRWNTGIEFIKRDTGVYPCEQESILEIYKHQLNWMIRHTDAKDLKPATGDLRKRQLEALDLAIKFFKLIEEIDVKPFMAFGTLLGAVRHKGFIPWDDDMDFAFIQDEYKRFIDFCKNNDKGIKYFYDKGSGVLETLEGERSVSTKDYPFLYLDWVGGCGTVYYNIGKINLRENIWVTDIMEFNYFRDDFTDEMYKQEYYYWLNSRREGEKDNTVFMKNLKIYNDNWREQRNIIVDKSERVGCSFYTSSGISLLYSSIGRTLEKAIWNTKDLFPLQKMDFEYTQFWAPCNPENFAKQINGDGFMSIPKKSVGIRAHEKDSLFDDNY